MAKFQKEIFKIDWFITQFHEFIEQPSYILFYILIHLLIFDLLSKCIANAYSKYRICMAALQRARAAPTARPRRSWRPYSVPTALPQRSHNPLSNTLCKRQAASFNFLHAQNKRRRMALWAIAQRAHGVAGDCTARTSAICNVFERYSDATLVWQEFCIWSLQNPDHGYNTKCFHCF